MQLTGQQQQALDKISEFLNSSKKVFILTGYAGTGKTTLVKSVVDMLPQFGRIAKLAAPTGRAAKILGEKTGCESTTIHRLIYYLEEGKGVCHDEKGDVIADTDGQTQTSDEEKKGRAEGVDDFQMWFLLNSQVSGVTDPESLFFIIDESSMIGSKKTRNEVLHFGTDVLLDDLLTFVGFFKGAKIMFVGDPAQLPPVGDNCSQALNREYFENKGISVDCFELTEVVRQGRDSAVLETASGVRRLLTSAVRNNLQFSYRSGQLERVDSRQIVESYVAEMPRPGIGNRTIISYTNAAVYRYNKAIRSRYFGQCDTVVPGDVLIVVKNQDGFCNGDFVSVLQVNPEVEYQSAPVWVNVAGQKVRKEVRLAFRKVLLKDENGAVSEHLIIESLLASEEPCLSPEQITALYINFRIRHKDIAKNHELLFSALLNDPYFNALNVKYGYAITCHKAQGGEWPCVYVDFSGRNALSDDSLRWIYTAVTRSSKMLYCCGEPNCRPMIKLQVKPITKLGKPARGSVALMSVPAERCGGLNLQTDAQRAKYLSVKEALARVDCYVKDVVGLQYDDRYSVSTPDGDVTVDCYYNASGLYTRYAVQQHTMFDEAVLEAFRSTEAYCYNIDYKPSSPVFEQLHSDMVSACGETGIEITNIVSRPEQYMVVYYLLTPQSFASVTFYINNQGFVTTAMPQSGVGEADEVLAVLMKRFENNN